MLQHFTHPALDDSKGTPICIGNFIQPIKSKDNSIYKVIKFARYRSIVVIKAQKVLGNNKISNYTLEFSPNSVIVIPEDPHQFIETIPL